MRINFRLNPEYDSDIIEKLKSIRKRELSKTIRKILREALKSDNFIKEKKQIKWNFPR